MRAARAPATRSCGAACRPARWCGPRWCWPPRRAGRRCRAAPRSALLIAALAAGIALLAARRVDLRRRFAGPVPVRAARAGDRRSCSARSCCAASEPRHAEQLVNAAGVAILAIPLVALAAGALQLLSLFGGSPASLLPGFWELVVLAAGCGLVAYGAVDRVAGRRLPRLREPGWRSSPWSPSRSDADAAVVAAAADPARARRDARRVCARAARCRPSPTPTAPASSRSPRARTRRSPSASATTLRRAERVAHARRGRRRPARSSLLAPPSRSRPSSTCSAPIVAVAGRCAPRAAPARAPSWPRA